MSPPGGSILSLVAPSQAIIFFWEQRFEQAIPKAEKETGIGWKRGGFKF